MNVQPGSISEHRAERPLVIALDIGSSSVRAALHDRQGRAVRGCSVQVSYSWNVGAEGSVRLAHDVLLDLVAEALDGLVARVGPLANDVHAGGISCFFHSVVGLDDQGQPITPVLSWADATSARQAADLRQRIDPRTTHACTGAPIHASYWPARVLRLRGEHPAAKRWAGFPELLMAGIIGRPVASRSMASGTGLFDRAHGTWSNELLEHLQIDPSELPVLVDDREPIGCLAGAAARRWPRLAHVVWFAPWGDGACHNVGLSATGPGAAALMVGTSGALRVLVDDPAPTLPGGLFAYRLGPGAVVGGQLSEGGGLLAWASKQLRGSSSSLEVAAAAMPADAHGLTVLPFIFGERGLGYHDDGRGAICGIAADTDAADIYRAIVESVAFSFAAVDEQLSRVLGVSPTITASGGALTRSALLAQVLADSLGRDITVTRFLEASLRGAALLALHSSGELTDLRQISALPGHTVRSEPSRSTRYRAARERRNDLYQALLGRHHLDTAWSSDAPWVPHPSAEMANTIES